MQLIEIGNEHLAVTVSPLGSEMQSIVTRDGHSIGDQMVAEGLARTWSGRREPWC